MNIKARELKVNDVIAPDLRVTWIGDLGYGHVAVDIIDSTGRCGHTSFGGGRDLEVTRTL